MSSRIVNYLQSLDRTINAATAKAARLTPFVTRDTPRIKKVLKNMSESRRRIQSDARFECISYQNTKSCARRRNEFTTGIAQTICGGNRQPCHSFVFPRGEPWDLPPLWRSGPIEYDRVVWQLMNRQRPSDWRSVLYF